MNMEAKKFKIRLIAIALALPMLFAACNSDEPTPPGGEQPENPTQGDVNSKIKPIVFETKNMYWQTIYNKEKNIYHTLCVDCLFGDIVYKYAQDADNPQKIIVEDFSIEVNGEIKVVDISELKNQASKSPEGYFNITLDGVTLKYDKLGELVVSYGNELDINMTENDKKFYNIRLSGDNGVYATTLRINDVLEVTGEAAMLFDLDKIGYPAERTYSQSGSHTGNETTIYIPAGEVEFPLIPLFSQKPFMDKMITLTYPDGKKEEIKAQNFTEQPESAALYSLEFEGVGLFETDAKRALNCKITPNTSSKERVLTFIVFSNSDRQNDGRGIGLIHIIQAGK